MESLPGSAHNPCLRKSLLLLYLFLLPFFISAQAELKLDPKKAVRGGNVVIAVKTRLPWTNDVKIVTPVLEGSLSWWAFPYARPWGAVNEDGSVTRMVEVRSSVRVDAPGFHSVAPFRIQSGGQETLTETAHIIGLEADEGAFPYPIFIQWRNPPETVRQGQTIPITIEAQNLPSLTAADSAVLSQVPAGLLEEAPGYGEILTRTYGENFVYDIPMASWMWTLSDPGVYQFPEVRVKVNGLVRIKKGFAVTVKPLSAEAGKYGAVGRFRLSTYWDERTYKTGDIILIRIQAEGEGNLSVLSMPVPKATGATFAGIESVSSYQPSAYGYTGRRENIYSFRIDTDSRLEISVPRWTWFDPGGSGRANSMEEQHYTLDIQKAVGKTVLSSAERLLGADIFHYRKTVFYWKNPFCYLLAAPGFFAAVLFFFRKRTRRTPIATSFLLPLLLAAATGDTNNIRTAANARHLALQGRWEQAAAIYESLSEQYHDLPGLLHDRAIVAAETNQPALAVSLIMRSLYLKPGTGRIARTLEYLRQRLNLSHQVEISLFWPPSAVFLIWILAVNGLFIALARLFLRRSAPEYIFMVLATAVFAASTAVLGYSAAEWNKPIGVLETEQALQKIPGTLADEWIRLPAGTTVELVSADGNDCLVSTGFDVKGWLPLSSLYLINGENDGIQ